MSLKRPATRGETTDSLGRRSLIEDLKLVGSCIEQTRNLRPSDEIILALIVSEDKRFFRHKGVDPIAVVRAVWSIIARRRLQGGSTIEQQLVRTITGRKELTVTRKIREVVLASLIALSYDKLCIAVTYLFVAYFGWRMNGIYEACERLKINPESSSAAEAAALVARLKYPEPSNPNNARIRNIAQRTDYIQILSARKTPEVSIIRRTIAEPGKNGDKCRRSQIFKVISNSR